MKNSIEIHISKTLQVLMHKKLYVHQTINNRDVKKWCSMASVLWYILVALFQSYLAEVDLATRRVNKVVNSAL